MSTNIIHCSNNYISLPKNRFLDIPITKDYSKIYIFLLNYLHIDCSLDEDIIRSYSQDWSNIPGYANLLVRPNSSKQCAQILFLCYTNKIPITISAGKTNLTGSATPNGGVVLSTENMRTPNIELDKVQQEIISPIGIPLEQLRAKILLLSNNMLHFPVDPTSRHDAFVGGILACNASGFIPGEKGATRYWVKGIKFILPNGYHLAAMRGEYISKNGEFILQCDNKSIKIPIPTYERPKIKNASGPFSAPNGELDFIDFIIGSEGIYGMITSCVLTVTKTPKNHLEFFIRLKNEDSAIKLHQFLYDYFNSDLSKISALEYFGYNCQNYMKHKEFFFNNKNQVGVYLQIPIYEEIGQDKIAEWVEIFTSFDSEMNMDDIIVLNDPIIWNKFFESRHSIPDNALRKSKELGGISFITDTIVPFSNFKKYLNLVHKKIRSSKIEYLLFGHLGDCHLHFHLIPNEKQQKISNEIYNYMIDLSAKLGGVYSAEHGTGKRKRIDFLKCYGEDAYDMISKAKESLDPHFILNKGNVIN